MPEVCSACHAPALTLEGLGTERLETTLRESFPTARIARLDRDVADGKKAQAILARMHAREIDILVGTQMVTKGHDLPNVTLVGVVNADAALSLPDFRASERGFQLLVQVAGRAGRHEKPGLVIVQTRSRRTRRSSAPRATTSAPSSRRSSSIARRWAIRLSRASCSCVSRRWTRTP
jgi:primosomal protein N' (replication factor Y)